MKTVIDIVMAVVLLSFGVNISPKIINYFKKATINKIEKGLPSLSVFTKKLTKI